MNYEAYLQNAQAIFDRFPNEKVWAQGGLRPNRQLHTPEAGYCLVVRYGEKTTRAISHFMARVRTLLPPVVAYDERNLHTTIGTCGKRDMAGFVAQAATLQRLMKAVAQGLGGHPQNLSVRFGAWLFNEEAIILSGYPSEDLWRVFQRIGNACQEEGCPVEMAAITHLTTARFIDGVSWQVFEQFRGLMQSAPAIETAQPEAIDLATWRCDGRRIDLVTHQRYPL